MNQSKFDGESREYKKQISGLENEGKSQDLHVHCNSFLHDVSPYSHIHCEDDENCPENTHVNKRMPEVQVALVDPDCLECFADE
jgi:hypothetical protein